MEYRSLGESGVNASVVALGAFAMGGWMWGGTDEDQSIRAVHAALDHGVNFIDTAPIYGYGVSEQIVGKAIKDRRDQVVLATKCGMVCRPDVGDFKFRSTMQAVDAEGHIPVRIYLHPSSVRDEVEMSLRRLQTDYIDLIQTHWQDSTTPVSDTMAELLKLKDEGKVRAIGVCNAGVDQLSEYLEAGPIVSDQEKYSMLSRQAEEENLPFCEKKGIAVLAYSPLADGLLTGKIDPERTFGSGDRRFNSPKFSVENRRMVLRMLNEFQAIAENHRASMVQLVTAWTLSQPGVTHALCGMRNAEQATENAGAGSIALDNDEVARMTSILNRYSSTLA